MTDPHRSYDTPPRSTPPRQDVKSHAGNLWHTIRPLTAASIGSQNLTIADLDVITNTATGVINVTFPRLTMTFATTTRSTTVVPITIVRKYWLAVLKSTQVLCEFVGGRIPFRWDFTQTLQTRRFQISGRVAPHLPERRWWFADHSAQDRRARTHKGQAAGQQPIHQDAQTINVATRPHPLTLTSRLFG